MKKVLLSCALVAALVGCKNETKNPATSVPTTPPPVTPAKETSTPTTASAMITSTCYQFVLKKDLTSCQLIVDDKGGISGFYDWTPDQKDGGHGLLMNGQKMGGDTIVVDWKYMIEGTVQTEELMFKQSADKLIKLEGALDDKGGRLVVKDKKKLKAGDTLVKVDCVKLDEVIKNIGQIEKAIKEAK